MKAYLLDNTTVRMAQKAGILITLLTIALTPRALAFLGGSEDSVQDDQALLEAKVRTTTAAAYRIHELTSPLGILVREYVSQAGVVFAVSWQGPFQPDMKQILGSYFVEYSLGAKEEREGRVRRSPLNIYRHSLVFQSAGHMRAYFGRAYDPRLLPPGVNADELR